MKSMLLLANSDDMFSVAQEAIAHTGADIEVKLTHTYEETSKLAAEYERGGCRIIIARGAHARALRESNIKIPVTNIPFTGNNIVSLLMQASKDWGEFAVVGNPTMIQMTRELERPIGAKVHYYEINRWTDFNSIMPQIRKHGIKAVIGGYDSARAARANGLHDYCIKTSEYEIVTAIMEAKNLLAALERDRHWDSLFRATLDTISDGILVVDKKGSVTHANRRANKLIYNDRFVTSAPKELKAPMEKVMRSGEAVYDELIEFNDHKMTASFLPLRDEDDNMVISVQEVEHIHKIERKVRQKLANKGLVAKNSFDMLYANGQELQEAVRTAKQYAVVDSSVLICGETGTGKEMFAQSIHNYSSRRDEAFVAVNCATIAPNLLESELFGYVEGAFTGAKRGGKIGLFELAHKGTIFLDEIGETSLEMQARLLRVLEEHEIMRVGDDKVIPVDIRVIAATNRDLQQMVEEGKFRSDFYYRLDVLALRLPPLRVCRENIVPLIKHFNSKYSERHAKHSLDFTDESLEVFKKYGWPGNVRELKNVIERLVVTNRGDIVDADAARTALYIKKESNSKPMQEASDKGLMNAAEMELIRNVLKECGGNKTAAAKKLGISRPTLHRKLKLMEAGDDA